MAGQPMEGRKQRQDKRTTAALRQAAAGETAAKPNQTSPAAETGRDPALLKGGYSGKSRGDARDTRRHHRACWFSSGRTGSGARIPVDT